MPGLSLRLLELFLADAHFLAQRLGINRGVFHLRENVPCLLSGMGSDLAAQLAKLLIIPRLARVQITERLDCVAGFFLNVPRLLQDIVLTENFTHSREEHFVLDALMNSKFIADFGNERVFFRVGGSLFRDGIELAKSSL